MGHAQKSHDGGVQTPPTRKTRNELEELGEENKQLREAGSSSVRTCPNSNC
jgi:hypothetical protein